MKTPTIDRQKKTITVTKEFMILAGQFDTQEFDPQRAAAESPWLRNPDPHHCS